MIPEDRHYSELECIDCRPYSRSKVDARAPARTSTSNRNVVVSSLYVADQWFLSVAYNPRNFCQPRSSNRAKFRKTKCRPSQVFTYPFCHPCILRFDISARTLAQRTWTSSSDHPRTRVNGAILNPSSPSLKLQ